VHTELCCNEPQAGATQAQHVAPQRQSMQHIIRYSTYAAYMLLVVCSPKNAGAIVRVLLVQLTVLLQLDDEGSMPRRASRAALLLWLPQCNSAPLQLLCPGHCTAQHLNLSSTTQANASPLNPPRTCK
jgi:hypothetical protein